MPVYIVIVMWSIYFCLWLRSRRERRSMNSIATFNRHLAVLARASPGRAADTAAHRAGMSLAEARRRRRQVLTALAVAASVTAALAFVGGGPFVLLHLLADVLLAGYVVALARSQHAVAERRAKVVYLPPRPVVAVPAEPAYLRRSAN